MSNPSIEWLPPKIDISEGTYLKMVHKLYARFQMDIKCGNIIFQGSKVGYRPGYEPSGMGYEKIFWHLITADEAITGERVLDHERASRLSWIKPVLEHSSDPCIKVWDYEESNRKMGIRTYVWLEELDFIIVLQKVLLRSNKTVMNIITSFHINGPSYRAKIRKKWEKRLQEG